MEQADYNRLFFETKSISGKKFEETGSTNPGGQRDWLIRKHKFPEGVVDYVMQETYLLMSQGKREFIDGMDFDLYLELRCQEVMKDEIKVIVELRQNELKSLIDVTTNEEIKKLIAKIEICEGFNKEYSILYYNVLDNIEKLKETNTYLLNGIDKLKDKIRNFKDSSILKRIWMAIKKEI